MVGFSDMDASILFSLACETAKLEAILNAL